MQGLMKLAPGLANVGIGDTAEPDALPGHVIIEVAYTGICGTDLHIYHDEFKTKPPVVMGHEISGRIAEIGTDVVGLHVGQRVTTETYYSTCQRCAHCRNGRPNLCMARQSIGSAVNGGFARYVRVPAHNIHLIPDHVSDQAAALSEPLACVVNAVELGHITTGDVVVIAGPGTIGLLTLQVAQSAGAHVIVLGTRLDEARLALARQIGASACINIDTTDPLPHINALSAGLGADVVIECAGAGPAASALLQLVRRGGRYMQIGLFGTPISWDMDQVCYRELIVTGSNASVPSAWRRALRLLANGTVRTEPLISDIRPINDWQRAFADFEAKSGFKILLTPT